MVATEARHMAVYIDMCKRTKISEEHEPIGDKVASREGTRTGQNGPWELESCLSSKVLLYKKLVYRN